MPLYKRQTFVPLKPPPDLKPDEEIFYLKLTNEIFRSYDEYFDRMILCNSLVWSCALTGKANLTYQEALESENAAKEVLKGFPKDLKRALFYLVTLTERGKVLDVCEDVFIYARERYFKNEVVLGVIGNLWCPSRVLRVIYPTKDEIEAYKLDQIQKGAYEKNDYLKDDSWGPHPDLFRYEVQETEPDNPDLHEVHILEAIDVKREKTLLTRDKCRFLIKLATYYCDTSRRWRLRDDVIKSLGIANLRFEDIFIGPAPKFEVSLGPPPRTSTKSESSKKQKGADAEGKKERKEPKPPKEPKETKEKQTKPKKSQSEKEAKKPRSKSLNSEAKPKANSSRKSLPPEAMAKEKKKPGPKPKKEKEPKPVEKKLTQAELKQIESERKAQEREKQRHEKKMIADFKKLWFKPKEDLEVEDLKELPSPDPVSCKIPNNLFGDFLAVLEFFNTYANNLKVRDFFSSGLTFDALEKALTKNEIAGPLSDILQLLLRSIFRLEEAEHADINHEHEQTAGVELEVDEGGSDVSVSEAVDQATTAATWCTRYQNTPLHKLNLDHLNLSEVLRLHLLSSGARPSEKDVKWRYQNRGCYGCHDDPGLRLRVEEPQILKTLSHGTVFDLSIKERLKLITCLMNQYLTYFDIRELMEESSDQWKQAKTKLRALQAEEKRKDAEDNLWKTRLRADRIVPDPSSLKAGTEKDKEPEREKSNPPSKPLLTDEQIEALIEKKDKEILKRKQDYEWKESELYDTCLKHERRIGLHPIGRDRAYRRYWLFHSLAGLFVEWNDEYVGPCLLQPTPYIEDVNLNDVNFVKENMGKFRNSDREGSDKENSTLGSPKKTPKKKQQAIKAKEIPAPSVKVFGICNGDQETCPVHCHYLPRPKWYFFWNVEQLDALIEGLTPRGIREKDLKTFLTDEKEGLTNLLKRCPVSKLNVDNTYPEHVLSIAERKANRGGQHSSKHLDPNLNYEEGTSVDYILELQLRDMILETEEKVYLGTLGSLKVNDRQMWRKALEDRSYDPQVDSLKWGRVKVAKLDKLTKNISVVRKDESDHEDTESTGTSENRSSGDSPPANPVVRDLAYAVLQLSQSVEPKFLKKPLGTKEESKGKLKSAALSDNRTADSAKSTITSPLERWELSLIASTSFSQLFLHLFTLDNSIEWARSVLNARCRICRRKGDPDQMLLCDECNKGHHAYCLKPPLQVIPKGDWYCSDCRPPEPPPKVNRRKAKQYLSDDDIADEVETSSDEDSSEEGSHDKKHETKANGFVEDGSDEGGEAEVCEICHLGGQVMCCDNCPKLYHLQCLIPPKTRVPRGTWYCPTCTSGGKRVSSQKKAKSYGKSKKATVKKKISRRQSSEEELSSTEVEENEYEEDSDALSNNNNVENEDVNHATNSDHGSSAEEDSDDDEKPRMQVKIRGPIKATTAKTRHSNEESVMSSRKRPQRIYSDSEDDDFNDHHGRGSKRKSASAAAERIAKVAKRLRSDSKENDSSENSNDSYLNHMRVKRSYDSDGDNSGNPEGPKRTRLQRMHKNERAVDGELDNVLMDRLLKDVMKHPDAWPFLKPVTKADAPDYHDIIKNPMDLGTIKYKLNSMDYSCNEEVISDLMLVFSNCLLYNDPAHAVARACVNLKSFCERRCSRLGIHFSDEPPAN